ncbi:3'-5' exonuclease [Paracraurococcus lichenis]|uniref:DNA 3'-5' helicase n=1 Tax=Paracraurococcus lichenis TaxID=3064888 RepID=A0ABT9E7X6_9PROT|nr:3'-5' exonuclease [Paracraurococcus sp. LOR1-02]MDO9712303.1 3'-5' exonuclease [Paracraurococcus sp. LOR1-02]
MSLEFRIAATFTAALARLAAPEQKAAKTTAFDLQMDPAAPGLKFHRIDRSRDPHFWSVRVNSDIRIIVHKTDASFLLAYVGHHDDSYAWAERRRIEAHPRTGAIQIVEVRERVEEFVSASAPAIPPTAAPELPLPKPLVIPFRALSDDDLLGVGVPSDWVADVRKASEDAFLAMAEHLPAEAAEALLEYVGTGRLPKPAPTTEADPFAHPDALRRFRVVENQEALALALDAPWERWAVFLHPAQQGVVDRSYNGPARTSGSAGTGKTVVALHRAARLAQEAADGRVLLTTFSQPLAKALARKLAVLVGDTSPVLRRVTVLPYRSVADELYQLAFGRRAVVASDEQVEDAVLKAAEGVGAKGFTTRFLLSEWRHVVDAWQIADVEAYARVPRLGRKNRMSAGQRERLWPVFAAVRASLAKRGLATWPDIFGRAAAYYATRETKPFTHIVVDEAQDLGVAELRFLAAIAPAASDALFFAGDLGQRIFQQPFSWKELGVDVRGRSSTLTVNYRTSHQIRQAADRLLPSAVRDVDGNADDRNRTVSVFNGPAPTIQQFDTEAKETAGVAAWIAQARADGILSSEIGVFVRSRVQLQRARAAVEGAGLPWVELSEQDQEVTGSVLIGTMHLAKGLEFKAAAVIACDDGILPLQERLEAVADETELDDVYETERQLFYVACTRARERLLISATRPISEFIQDIASTREE